MHNASLHYPSSIFLKLTVAWQILLLNLSLCLADLREPTVCLFFGRQDLGHCGITGRRDFILPCTTSMCLFFGSYKRGQCPPFCLPLPLSLVVLPCLPPASCPLSTLDLLILPLPLQRRWYGGCISSLNWIF